MKKTFVKPEVAVKSLQSEMMIATSVDGLQAVQQDAIGNGWGVQGGGSGDNEARSAVEADWDLSI